MKKILLLLLVIPMVFSCKKSPVTYSLQLTETDISMSQNETNQLRMLNYGNVDTLASFISMNKWVAQVQYTGGSGGLVTAKHVGTTMVKAYEDTTILVCNVVVVPKSHLYVEPYFLRGTVSGVVEGTRSAVMNYEKPIRGVPVSTADSLTLTYNDPNPVVESVVYHFTKKVNDINNVGALHDVVITLDSGTTIDDLKAYLTERYDYYTEGIDGFTYYLSDYVENKNNQATFEPAYKQNADNTITVYYQWANGI